MLIPVNFANSICVKFLFFLTSLIFNFINILLLF
nr:MAG TPA: hypothetical protein [Caudoviricetes sp.]